MAYDSTNKRVYRDTSSTPNLGVGFEDVRTALSENTLDEGRLCRSSKVNMFAKYKPVGAGTLGMTGKTSGSDYWKGSDGQCGITIPRSAYNDRMTFARGTVVWSRATPSAWYQILDFDGYDASGKVKLSNSSSIPAGRLVEEDQSALAFNNGVPIFHVALNSQDDTGYFLTVNDIKLYYSSTQIPLTDMLLRVLLVSYDGTMTVELKGGALKREEGSHEDDPYVEMTLGEMMDAGITQVTFSPYYTFYVENVTNNPVAGDVYSYSDSDFLIQEVVLDGSTLKASSIVCVRTSGSGTIPTSSYLARSSGSGDASIAFTNYEVESYTFGGRTFYVMPILYSPSYSVICGLGGETPMMALSSVTNRIDIQFGSVAWSRVSSTVSYTITGSVSNGVNAAKTVTLKIYTANSADYGNLPDREVEHTETVSVAALQTQGFTFTESTSDNSYTSVRADYTYVDGEGNTVNGVLLDETIYDQNGNVFDPLNQ